MSTITYFKQNFECFAPPGKFSLILQEKTMKERTNKSQKFMAQKLYFNLTLMSVRMMGRCLNFWIILYLKASPKEPLFEIINVLRESPNRNLFAYIYETGEYSVVRVEYPGEEGQRYKISVAHYIIRMWGTVYFREFLKMSEIPTHQS